MKYKTLSNYFIINHYRKLEFTLITIRRLFQKLTDNEFVKSVVILVSGSSISQIIVVLITPVLTRLYTPEDFGVLSVYMSIVLTVTIISSLHYEVAIPLPKKEKDAIHLLILSLGLLVFTTIIITFILQGIEGALLKNFQTKGLQEILYFIPLSLLGFGIFRLFEMWMIRQEDYMQITVGKVRMNLSQVFSQSGLGWFIPSASSLMAGEVLGRLIGGGGMAYVSWKDIKDKLAFLSFKTLVNTAHRYIRFPLIASWSSLLSGLSQHLPTLFIASQLGVREAGWYFLAYKILALPDALLGYSVRQVYIGKSAKMLNNTLKEFTNLFWNTIKKLGMISLFIYVSVDLIAPFIFPIVFGSAWGEASLFLQCLSIFFLFQLIIGPISATFIILEEQYLFALSEILKFIILIIGMAAAYLFLENSLSIVLLLSIAQGLGSIIIGLLAWTALKRKRYKVRKEQGA